MNRRSFSVWNLWAISLLIALPIRAQGSRSNVTPDSAPFPIWSSSQTLKNANQLPKLQQTKFHVIKAWNRSEDGFTFLHGVGLAWFQDQLFASFGHNKGEENTVTEEAHYRVSPDGGKTWSELMTLDAGDEANLAVSHGVFLPLPDQLWAFHGAYYHKMEHIHTRAYRYDDAANRWLKQGTVIGNGFWPMNQPVKMLNGNWIMPGFTGGPYDNKKVFPAAVAISDGDDFKQWELVTIPVSKGISRMWGESSIFVDGASVYNIARYGGRATALVAVSHDYGRTWTPSQVSNLPMTTSKPAAGVLSSGHRYLIGATAANNRNVRRPLTIALSQPNTNQFSRVWIIRNATNTPHPGESSPELSLAYPYAVEHQGNLYIGYSNNGGRRANLNSAELAIVSIAEMIEGLE